MMLNKSNGNMYTWVTHTFNTIKGECYHDCSYCYMKRWGKQKPIHFDEKELKTDLGTGNFIFVGSSCDMWANDIPEDWIFRTLCHCNKFDNKYLFQTKNPYSIRRILVPKSSVCVTLETNRFYKEIMGNSPTPDERVTEMCLIRHPLYITIEPIIDFDLIPFVEMIKTIQPLQVNIGANSDNKIKLPEPSKDKLLALIDTLKEITVIDKKNNLTRLLK